MSYQRGLTLIEVMVAVIIIAVLATMALPAYQHYVHKARRSDAYNVLLLVQNRQEKWRTSHSEYSNTFAELGLQSGASLADNYSFALSDVSAHGYQVTATAQHQQLDDSECATITLVVSTAYPRGIKSGSGDNCW